MILLVLLDIDPNVVKPGWTPLIITIGLAAVVALLYLSLRRQFRKIATNFPEPDPAPDAESDSSVPPAGPGARG